MGNYVTILSSKSEHKKIPAVMKHPGIRPDLKMNGGTDIEDSTIPNSMPPDEPADFLHVATPVMLLIVEAARESFTEEQLFWLSEEFEILALAKLQTRLIRDDGFAQCGEGANP